MGTVSGFMIEAPPSTTKLAPVMYELNPLAKNPATLAISIGIPALSSPMMDFCALDGQLLRFA